jgi:succinoglycan biosynthesis transport protein ExoP
MDTMDSPDAKLPARLTASSAGLPAHIHATARELTAANPPSAINHRALIRGLVRNWWRILLLWLIISVPLTYLIFVVIEPSYEASSTLRIEPTKPELFGPAVRGMDATGFQPYLETQRNLILTDRVLEEALAQPSVQNFPILQETDSNDPKVELRKKLLVMIVPSSYLIRVSYHSNNRNEAFAVVKEVVDAFIRQHRQFNLGDTDSLKSQYENYVRQQREILEKKKLDLIKLVETGHVEPPALNSKAKGDAEESSQEPLFDKLSIEQYRRTNDQLLQTEMDLMDARSLLQARLAESQGTSEIPQHEIEKQLYERIVEEFRRDPQVAAIIEQIRATTEELDHSKSIARREADPALLATRKRLANLTAQYNDLWDTRNKQIRKKLLVETGAPVDSTLVLRRKIEVMEAKKKNLLDMLQKYRVEKQQSGTDSLKAAFWREEIGSITGMIRTVEQKLEQLKFESSNQLVRVFLQDKASPPKMPSINKRNRYMAMLPVGILFAVVGLFLLLEIKAERVGDPDLLSSRVQSEVYALPPLPTNRGPRRLSGPALDDQIDRFIQRLDHLRFAVCGGAHDTDLGRCILVTSAVGGEGKTTLSAQLAARCGNAGISTLLIDADLRRAALCPLLDVPEGPGLSDALQNETNAEDLAIPVQGGTFHLLSAGTPVHDPSRVLQGRTFAMLIAQLRRRYEMIIIDSPPVLPIPDALVLGRWTDGALLAARFEVSRSPQVERARRQLDQAGIPVLGTVINGMRSSDSYYGRYTYGRQRHSQSDVSEST